MKWFIVLFVVLQNAFSIQLPGATDSISYSCHFKGTITNITENNIIDELNCRIGDSISLKANFTFKQHYNSGYNEYDYFESICISEASGLPMDYYINHVFSFADISNDSLFCESSFLIIEPNKDSTIYWLYIEVTNNIENNFIDEKNYIYHHQDFYMENNDGNHQIFESIGEEYTITQSYTDNKATNGKLTRHEFSVVSSVKLVSFSQNQKASIRTISTDNVSQKCRTNKICSYNILGQVVKGQIPALIIKRDDQNNRKTLNFKKFD